MVAQDVTETWEDLARPGDDILYLVIDGIGGLPNEHGETELEAADTPHLDALADQSVCGLLEPVGPGITPGSGPGHLALFGYDPLRYTVGRGILAALGIDFDLQPGDVAARINFASMDDGVIIDRRAGRISTSTNERLCGLLRDSINLAFDGTFYIQTVKEHRALLVLRGPGLNGDITDTDPQVTGQPARAPQPRSDGSRKTADLVASFIEQVNDALTGETANTVLLRGFDTYQQWPTLEERFGLHGVCLAQYPMYRGVSRLVGMDVHEPAMTLDNYAVVARGYRDTHDFYFLHVKPTDSRGEDGDFDAKVEAIEAADALIPALLELEPEVFVVTADHSTPAAMATHSWHPVPVLLKARHARRDRVTTFDEAACLHGGLGIRPGIHLMGLALAHAGRLEKYGA
ncbi:MAG: 2,3-bisphosphoglycerate-independent phosphoglycerate mutase [Thermoplasmatota archaeon]